MTAKIPTHKTSMRQTARELNINQNYFAHLKSTNKEAWEYMTKLDSNLFNSYTKYMSEKDTIKAHLTDIYYLLQDLSLISQFSKHLQRVGHYNNWNGFSTSISRVLFGFNDGFSSHKVFIKCKALIDEFCVFYTKATNVV